MWPLDAALIGFRWGVLCLGIFSVESSTVIKVREIDLRKKDVAALTELCGPDIYCLPKFNGTWTMGSVGLLRWNPNYPTFKVEGYVDIRLFEMTNTRKPIKEWLNITNDDGLWSIKLDHSTGIFPKVYKRPKNTTVTRHYRFLVTAKNDVIEGKQKGPIFSIADPPPPEEVNPPLANPLHFAIPITIHSLLTDPDNSFPSAVSHDSNRSQNEEYSGANATTHSGNVPFTVIGIAMGALVALILLVGLIYYLMRRCGRANFVKRAKLLNRNHANYPPMIATQYQGVNDLSRYSISGYTSTDAFLPANEAENQSHLCKTNDQHSQYILATPPNNSGFIDQVSHDFKSDSLRLTVKDAQLIADTYRRLLRKPSWNDEEGKELAKRNTYTDKLLRQELEAEGKGVKHVNTAPTIVVVNEEQKLRRTNIMSVGQLEV